MGPTPIQPAPNPAPGPGSAPTAVAAPAPAPPPDAWSAAIDKGRNEETTQYEDVREKKEERDARVAFETSTLGLRSRLRFFVAASLGLQNYSGLYFDYNDEPVTSNTGFTVRSAALQKLLGAGAHVGAGIRGSIAEHFDLQTRLSLSFARVSGQAYLDGEQRSATNADIDYISNHYDNVSATLIGLRADGTIRWLPQLMGPRFFVGLGPLLELSSVSVSTSGLGGPFAIPAIDINEMVVSAHGLLELGVILGAQEDWELGLRGSAGAALGNNSKDVEFVGANVARAF